MPNLSNEFKTIIDTADKIQFCNSPIHLRQTAVTVGNLIKSVTHYLWVWNGDQNKVLGDANYTIQKILVSQYDNYINVNIADLIKAWLVSPENARNTNQPQFAWNPYALPAQTGQGVFYQIISEVLEQEPATEAIIQNTVVSPTYFATLGYRWNYEQNAGVTNGLTPYKSDPFGRSVYRYYNQSIDNYFTNSFNLGQSVATCTSGNMIAQTKVTPQAPQKFCARDSYLIVFLNKLGLWDYFTPFGKTIISSKATVSNSNRMFRDPSQIDNSQVHSSLRDSINVLQSYSINSGLIDETATQLITELVYSPKVYLIRYQGDKVTTATTGITVDNTYITVDNTNITVDNSTVSAQSIGYFSTFQQIPVIITNPEELINKTRLNDKIKIEYVIRFDETNNKILDIK
ncbi:hypothetical protein GKZ90_0021050 [Flavobacterium sp. MC2016-06]|uniref:hypothetical protein n=1 Tax=Flavobacterium sp. MC2016-06 TaxID=2676308 RepID=UPI0012BAAB12|nr:hypothetical protein [Flavobacterium sp. MC2016-06]MBU3860989.1 hypothetical protein [Flavobacterium sp. MC2016-06]